MIGFKGERGYSAYEIAVQNGFVGSEQSWLAQLGTSNSYGQDTINYTTITKNQNTIPLPEKYTSNSIITIYIDGLKLNETSYSIDSVNRIITLETPIENIGTTIEIAMTTMTTTNLPITTEVNSSSTDKTAPSSKCVYNIKKGLEAKIEESNLPSGGSTGQALFKKSDNNNDVEWQDIFKKIYPIGSIFMTVNKTNPSEIFGGTWVTWGEGKVPVGVDVNDTDFATVEKIGGEKTHVLTESEMPRHRHRTAIEDSEFSTNVDYAGYGYGKGKYYNPTEYTGGGQEHNNIQPYITCYMFKRIA